LLSRNFELYLSTVFLSICYATGAFGKVYKGVYTTDGETIEVAVKTLRGKYISHVWSQGKSCNLKRVAVASKFAMLNNK